MRDEARLGECEVEGNPRSAPLPWSAGDPQVGTRWAEVRRGLCTKKREAFPGGADRGWSVRGGLFVETQTAVVSRPDWPPEGGRVVETWWTCP